MRSVNQSTAYNLAVFMTDSTDHIAGKTGLTLAVTISKNGGAFSSISPVVTELSNGWYNVALGTGDTNTLGDLAIHISATGADPTDLAMQVVVPVVTANRTLNVAADGDIGGNVDGSVASVVGNVGGISGTITTLDALDSAQDAQHNATLIAVNAIPDAVPDTTDVTNSCATAITNASLATASALSTVDTEVGQILAVTNKLDTALEADGASGHQFTILALENAPSGSGASASAIADAVWTEAIADHVGVSGSVAAALNAAGAAGDPWTTALPGAYSAGQAGHIIGNLNDLSSAEVNAACDAAIADASLATAASLSSVASNVTTILGDTGTDIPALINGLTDIDAAGVRSAIGLSSANIDTQLTTIDTEVGQIKAVTDLLNQAQSEPSGVPAANETPLEKLGYLFMALRNRVDVTAAGLVYYDDSNAAEWRKALSDDGTTYTEAEATAP